MTPQQAIDKVQESRDLLDQVYSVYGDPDTELGRSLSVADTCMEEALEDLVTIQLENEIG